MALRELALGESLDQWREVPGVGRVAIDPSIAPSERAALERRLGLSTGGIRELSPDEPLDEPYQAITKEYPVEYAGRSGARPYKATEEIGDVFRTGIEEVFRPGRVTPLPALMAGMGVERGISPIPSPVQPKKTMLTDIRPEERPSFLERLVTGRTGDVAMELLKGAARPVQLATEYLAKPLTPFPELLKPETYEIGEGESPEEAGRRVMGAVGQPFPEVLSKPIEATFEATRKVSPAAANVLEGLMLYGMTGAAGPHGARPRVGPIVSRAFERIKGRRPTSQAEVAQVIREEPAFTQELRKAREEQRTGKIEPIELTEVAEEVPEIKTPISEVAQPRETIAPEAPRGPGTTIRPEEGIGLREGVPAFISAARRQELADLGYRREEIAKMTPAEAQSIVQAQRTAPRAPEVPRAETKPPEGEAPAVQAAKVPETHQGLEPEKLTAKEVVSKIEDQQAPEHFDKPKITKQVEKGGETYVKTEVDPTELKVPGEKTVEPGISAPEKGPIVVDDKGKVIDGRHRVVDAKEAGEPTIEAYVPEKAAGELAAEPGAERIKGPVVIVGDEIFRGRTHGEAVEAAKTAGVIKEHPRGGFVDRKGRDLFGTGWTDLFETTTGRIINRFQANRLFGVSAAENLQAKQPWEMTKREWAEAKFAEWQKYDTPEKARDRKKHPVLYPTPTVETWINQPKEASEHYGEVKSAVALGKPVPPEVLADYPDLAKGGIQPTPPLAGGEVPAPDISLTKTAAPTVEPRNVAAQKTIGPTERRAQLEQAIADGENRLRTRKNAIGERLSGKEIAATRKAVAEAKKGLAEIEKGIPPSVEPTTAEPTIAAAQSKIERVATASTAKEQARVKKELASRLEALIEKAPSEAEIADQIREIRKTEPTYPTYNLNLSAAEVTKARKAYEAVKAEWEKQNGPKLKRIEEGRITIEIPGDGTFRLKRTKEALTEVLSRVKKIPITERSPYRRAPTVPKRTGDISPDTWIDSNEPTHMVSVKNTGYEGGEQLVKGKRIKIPGVEDMELWLTSDGESYAITEPRTGRAVGRGSRIKTAIAEAEENFKTKREAFDANLKERIAEEGERTKPRPMTEADQPEAIAARQRAEQEAAEARYRAETGEETGVPIEQRAEAGRASEVEPKPAAGESPYIDLTRDPATMARHEYVESRVESAMNNPLDPDYGAMKNYLGLRRLGEWEKGFRPRVEAEWFEAEARAGKGVTTTAAKPEGARASEAPIAPKAPADLSTASLTDLAKKGFGSETGAIGKLTPEQQAIEVEARAARKEIYRRLSVEAAKTGETLEAVAERMKLPPGALQRLQAEQEPTQPRGFVTGIKNVQVDKELVELGLPPATHGERVSFEDARAAAERMVQADPFAGKKLVDDLSRQPRPVTATEDALLLTEQTRLKNERIQAENALIEAQKSGDQTAIGEARARVDAAMADFMTIGDVVTKAGTESSLSLGHRRMMMKEDYSLTAMERGAAISKGRPLTEAESAEIKTLHEKITTTQKAFDEYVAKAELEKAEAESAATHFRLLAESREKPTVVIDPAIQSLVERVVASMESQADAARVRLREKLSRLHGGLDPTIVTDMSIIGAAKIARVGLDFGRWSKAMVEDLGEKIRPYLQAAWEASNKRLESHIGRMAGGKKEPVERVIKGTDLAEQREAAKGQLRAKVESGEDIFPQAQTLARLFVEQGIKERGALIDAVHGELKEVIPDITRRQVMDAISGYGRYRQLSKDEISVELRDLKGQMQQVAKLEDIQSREPPLKTGVERRIPTDEERRLIQQVNEAKRRFGVVVTDPATQLQSALGARKTYYRNQISDLEAQIAAKEKFVKEKTAPPTDAELEGLKVRRDELKQEFDAIFGTPGLTDAQRVAMAVRGLAKSITELEQRIKTGDIGPRTRVSKTPSTPELEAMRARRDALREQLQELRDAATPKKTPEQIALQSLKTRLANNTADLLDRVARGDFAKKPRREIALDPEAVSLKFENAKAKAEFETGKLKDELANRSIPQKIVDGIGEINSIFVALRSSFDISFLRQATPMALAHPIRVLKQYPAAFKSLLSEKGQYAVEQELASRPNLPMYRRGGLAQLEKEEVYRSRWASKIPGIAASERAYTTPLNKLRADSMDSLVKTTMRWLGSFGKLTLAEEKAFANYANVATGRGKMSPGGALKLLSTVFWSPRLAMSRWQLALGQPLYGGSWRTRVVIGGEYARQIASAITLYSLAKMLGPEVEIETDWRSSDFGKIRIGNTRLDPLGGLLQIGTLLGRLYTGEIKSLARGKVSPIRGEKVPYGGATVPSILGGYLRSKLSPAVGVGLDIFTGKKITGEQVLPETALKDLLVPLNLEDIYEMMREQGFPEDLAFAILSTVGIGMQTFNPQEKRRWDRRTFGQRYNLGALPLSEYRESPRQ